MAWQRPAWLTMNVWTVSSGIAGLTVAALGVYLAVPATSNEARTTYTITSPGEADQVDLCLPLVKGAGQLPHEGSVWLVLHAVSGQGYYLARQIRSGTSDQDWVAGPVQVGRAVNRAGQQYELILWQLDPQLTGVVSHMLPGMRVFDGLPPGASIAAHTTVVRTADKSACP